jgi:tetratricopeptide (TPR) repeat protein
MIQKIAGWVVAAALGAAVATPAVANNWVRVDSAHFTVFSDIGPTSAQAYLIKLEQYRYILSGFYGISKEDDESTPKLRFYFVDTRDDLRQTAPHLPDDVAGYFKSCAEGEGAVGLFESGEIRQTQNVKTQEENPTQAVLFHEYAHDFMFQHSDRAYPPWFVEGFAEFYSTTKIQGDEAIVGMAFSWRVNSLLYGARSIPYADLLRDSWRPKKGEPSGQLEDAFYAQSWLLTHYILSDPPRHQKFAAFMDAYHSGEDPVAAFERVFGIKVKDLDNILVSYFNKMQASVYRIHDMPAPVVTATTLPPSAKKLLLWDAYDRMCPAPDDQQALLAKIQTEAAKYPGDAFAEDVLARAEIVIGDESQALDYLKQRVAAHPDDAEAYFMLGQTWYLMTIHKHILDGQTPDSQKAAARAALGKSYQLDPLYAPNLYYYSLALAVPGQPPSDNMIAAAMEAQALSPSVDTYAVHAAQLLVVRDRMAEAKEMLIPLASNPHAPKPAAWAANIIAIIDRQGSQAEVLAALKAPVDPDAAKAAPQTPPAKPSPSDSQN